VVVDGHPICAVCGAAIRAIGPDRWAHATPRRPFDPDSRWLRPVTPRELARQPTYEAFAARHPVAVRPSPSGVPGTTPDDWREGRDRLERYAAALRRARRRRRFDADWNPLLELVRLLGHPTEPGRAWAPTRGLAAVLDLPGRRRELVAAFAWAVPDEPVLRLLAVHAPLVEVGAGTGYWAALLRARGVDVEASDAAPPGADSANPFHAGQPRPWTAIDRAIAVEAVRRHPGRTLLLCWPPAEDDPASYAPLRAFRGATVVHIGDVGGDATGSLRFRRELERNWRLVDDVRLPGWPWLDDRLRVYRRNPERRPLDARDRCSECRRFLPTGAIGRCDRCFRRRPPALAIRSGPHRVEFPAESVAAMPNALRRALAGSRDRIR
jgi:hypothetical protein